MNNGAVQLVVGYLHILAGVIWFGTIFYVHIVLKPAYAAKGLPKGELTLGWTCITLVGVTGALLTIARMSSLEDFYTTRFGILLTAKIVFFLLMALSAALVTFVLGPRMKRRRSMSVKDEGEYTPDELGNFDGKEGRRALVANDGTVYDLTGSRLWKEGRHLTHLAGDDLTDALTRAPHGPEKLVPFPKAGMLVSEKTAPRRDTPKAAFYFIAYMNLALVFLILGIVALWRWW